MTQCLIPLTKNETGDSELPRLVELVKWDSDRVSSSRHDAIHAGPKFIHDRQKNGARCKLASLELAFVPYKVSSVAEFTTISKRSPDEETRHTATPAHAPRARLAALRGGRRECLHGQRNQDW